MMIIMILRKIVMVMVMVMVMVSRFPCYVFCI